MAISSCCFPWLPRPLPCPPLKISWTQVQRENRLWCVDFRHQFIFFGNHPEFCRLGVSYLIQSKWGLVILWLLLLLLKLKNSEAIMFLSWISFEICILKYWTSNIKCISSTGMKSAYIYSLKNITTYFESVYNMYKSRCTEF